ncbi:MAG: hypothetical protein Q8K92_13170 [Leadbetterella sp.]|nr:hypothetical protein [Leadbetterella sp.]
MYSRLLESEIKILFEEMISKGIHLDLDCGKEAFYKSVVMATFNVFKNEKEINQTYRNSTRFFYLIERIFISLLLMVFSILILTLIFYVSLFEEFVPIESKKKIILIGDYDPSSLSPFNFLEKEIKDSVLCRNFGINKLKVFKNLLTNNTHSFFYAKITLLALKQNIFFLKNVLKKLYEIEKFKNFSTKGKLLFSIEFIKLIYVSAKIGFIFKNVKNKLVILAQDVAPFYSKAIDYLKDNNATVVVIHGGCFFENNIHYVPTISKYVLVPSEREKKFYKRKNIKNIFSFGIPLQQLSKSPNSNSFHKKINCTTKYDILIIGGYGAEWENLSNYNIISENNDVFKNLKVLLRHHPSVDTESKKTIEEAVKYYELSSERTLEQDILDSEIIISFSVDSNITCLLLRKKLLYCASKETSIPLEFKNILPNFQIAQTPEEFLPKYSILNKTKIIIDESKYERVFIDNFGEFKSEIVLNRLNLILSEIRDKENIQ